MAQGEIKESAAHWPSVVKREDPVDGDTKFGMQLVSSPRVLSSKTNWLTTPLLALARVELGYTAEHTGSGST